MRDTRLFLTAYDWSGGPLTCHVTSVNKAHGRPRRSEWEAQIRDGERGTECERKTERERERQGETERDRKRQREKERERWR